ncbi:MAG: zf-HC2 domain-containing protein [Acidobacteriia bacterium]|nr:zf-HC2 domain-containing protein [Terriglobia bacterium]
MKDDVKSDGAKNKGVKSNDMSKKEIGVSQHPFDQEELMAFLDGELAAERAASAAAHLKNCLECQKLAAAFQQVSQAMVSWEVEQVGSEIPANIAAALNERKKDPARKLNSQRWEWRKLLRVQQLTWAAGLAAATLLVIAVSMAILLRSNKGAIESARVTKTLFRNMPAPLRNSAPSTAEMPVPPPRLSPRTATGLVRGSLQGKRLTPTAIPDRQASPLLERPPSTPTSFRRRLHLHLPNPRPRLRRETYTA